MSSRRAQRILEEPKGAQSRGAQRSPECRAQKTFSLFRAPDRTEKRDDSPEKYTFSATTRNYYLNA